MDKTNNEATFSSPYSGVVGRGIPPLLAPQGTPVLFVVYCPPRVVNKPAGTLAPPRHGQVFFLGSFSSVRAALQLGAHDATRNKQDEQLNRGAEPRTARHTARHTRPALTTLAKCQ